MPAAQLYTSALFRGRRAYVEASCARWWVLSALHGLVRPDRVLEPYDLSLKQLSAAERRQWSAQVLADLAGECPLGEGDVVEVHAGAEYRDYGLVAGLQADGVRVVLPAEGLSLGRQLRFYREQAWTP